MGSVEFVKKTKVDPRALRLLAFDFDKMGKVWYNNNTEGKESLCSRNFPRFTDEEKAANVK